jgi:hypothetical protein
MYDMVGVQPTPRFILFRVMFPFTISWCTVPPFCLRYVMFYFLRPPGFHSLATTAAAGVSLYLSSWLTVLARLLSPSSTVCPRVAWFIGQERRRSVYAIYPPFDESSACVYLTPHLTLSI